eukprot:IDg6542t1
MGTAAKLTSCHKEQRLEWALAQLRISPNKWQRTVFSDEKMLFLGGPDRELHYLAETRLDDNPIENFRACLVREVCAGFRLFENKEDLVEAITMAWDKGDLKVLRTIIRLMPDRCTE